MNPIQHTIDEQIDRSQRIERLERSMQRWRDTSLNERLPELYAHYCGVLEHLRTGRAYHVQTYSADMLLKMDRKERDATPGGALIRAIAEGFAHISRTWRRPKD